MGMTEWVLLAVGVLAVLGWWLWVQASRVDRLHRTVLRSRATLEAQLFRRATAATELAASGVLDPAESVIVTDVALRATDATSDVLVPDGLEGPTDSLDEGGGADGVTTSRTAPGVAGSARTAPDRGLLESELSRTLRAVLGTGAERAELAEDPHAADVLSQLQQAWYRLQVARRFHNAHVEQVRKARSRWAVRTFRLAGRAPLPDPFDMDDALPRE
ncbi:hypothetical protein ACFSBG_19110 [Georgenia yuyongxinii]|nr:hypothetical protein [Georgenia yuyongxinii]